MIMTPELCVEKRQHMLYRDCAWVSFYSNLAVWCSLEHQEIRNLNSLVLKNSVIYILCINLLFFHGK